MRTMQYRYHQGRLAFERCAQEDWGKGPKAAPLPDAVPKAYHMGPPDTPCLGQTGPDVASSSCAWGYLPMVLMPCAMRFAVTGPGVAH